MTHNTAYSTNKTKALDLPLTPNEPVANEEEKNYANFLLHYFPILEHCVEGAGE